MVRRRTDIRRAAGRVQPRRAGAAALPGAIGNCPTSKVSCGAGAYAIDQVGAARGNCSIVRPPGAVVAVGTFGSDAAACVVGDNVSRTGKAHCSRPGIRAEGAASIRQQIMQPYAACPKVLSIITLPSYKLPRLSRSVAPGDMFELSVRLQRLAIVYYRDLLSWTDKAIDWPELKLIRPDRDCPSSAT